MQLFCFHCAGGSSSMFRKWQFSGTDVIGLDLPGRGNRVNEPLFDQFDLAVEDLVNKVMRLRKSGQGWGVFGHSLGGLLAYEVSRRLQDHEFQCRIVSGINPIHQYRGEVKLLRQDDHTMIGMLADLGGLPEKYKNHPMFIKWFAPILRADLTLIKTFRYAADTSTVRTYVVNGLEDNLTRKMGVEHWKNVGLQDLTYQWVEGGHFSILQKSEVVERLFKSSTKAGVTS
ncbi:thioesterase II family protein [Halalkalibacter alkalisediminis]|uniref:Thioesterase II family protein n=1 Tax=Halalkalibacter alkalisediminis TaxID=935616 RepID=A0ABV6NQ34_9BACI|nr:alpha/beta fold hydrolase [Halalkalibacter alkalisediminis]